MTAVRPESAPGYGRLLRDEEADLVVCHECGSAFRALGSHLRVHGLTADQYRQRYGLLRTRALSARSLSRTRSQAQRQVFAASARMRDHFTRGQAMARTGELTRRARQALDERGPAPELQRERGEYLAAGRRTQIDASDEQAAAAARRLGFDCLATALRMLYVRDRISIEALAQRLGASPRRTRRMLTDHGIAVRAVGQNTPEGRRARVALNDRSAAEQLGIDDITDWLRDRLAGGATLRELAEVTGRSIPWVTARLRR